MSDLGIFTLITLATVAVAYYFLMFRIDRIFYKLNYLEDQIAEIHVQLAYTQVAEHVTHIEEEVINSFDSRILAIKNELGLRVPIADTHVQNTPEILHPNVYNIDNHEHDKYARYEETEIAR